MNVLITGGAGFIGSTLGEFLLNKGARVICYDNFDPFYPAETKRSNVASMMLHSNFQLVEGDINDVALLSGIFSSTKIDLVIHLAAKAGVRPSILDPRAYENVNVAGTLNLLEVMKQHRVINLLFGSSSSIYGNNEKIP